MTLIHLSEQGNVGVATSNLAPGEELVVGALRLVARDAIPFAHKVALRPIAAGEKVIKFGVPIGSATAAIEAATTSTSTTSRATTSTTRSTISSRPARAAMAPKGCLDGRISSPGRPQGHIWWSARTMSRAPSRPRSRRTARS